MVKEKPKKQVSNGGSKQQAVQTVEEPTVPGQENTGILNLCPALQGGFRQVTNLARYG
jgi:hypothetical protein